MDVIWTYRARQRLKEIYHYIAEDQRGNAAKWIDRIIKRGDSTREKPWMGRMVPEYKDDTIREILQGDYRIIYHPVSTS